MLKNLRYRISQYNKSKIHKGITNRLRRDFNEHSSNFDYNDTAFKIYCIRINANAVHINKTI